MNLSHVKNLDVIRDEYDKISKSLTTVSFIRAVIFILVGLAVGSALTEISSSRANEIVQRLRELSATTDVVPDLEDTFLKAIYGPILVKTQTPPAIQEEKGTKESVVIAPETVEKPSPAQVEQAKKEQTDLVAKLESIANSAFTFAFNAPLLGTPVKLDLRIWGFLLPLAIVLAEIYLSILRYKRRLLHSLAGWLAKQPSVETTVVDQLRFVSTTHRTSAFTRHPAQFELAVSILGGTALVSYIGFAGFPFWNGWDEMAKYALVDFYAILLVYAWAYVAYARRQLNQQIAAIPGFEMPRRPSLEILRKAGSAVRSLTKRIVPQVSLTTGSIMMLGTLGLLVGAPFGCKEQPRTGAEFLQNPDGWLVGPFRGINAINPTHNNIIAVLYATGLLLAAVTLLFVICSFFRRKLLGPNLLVSVLGGLATTIALFFLTDLPFGHLLDFAFFTDEAKPPELVVRFVLRLVAFLFWLVPIGLWLWFGYTDGPKQRARWPSRRASLWRWYLPQIGAALIVAAASLSAKHKLIGVPLFLAGIGLLAASYERLIRSREN